jgi:hypothetical protein
MIKEGSRTIRCEIQQLINSIWNNEEMPEEWKELIILPIYKKGYKRNHSNDRGHVISGSLSPRHGASSGCGWRNGLRYGG